LLVTRDYYGNVGLSTVSSKGELPHKSMLEQGFLERPFEMVFEKTVGPTAGATWLIRWELCSFLTGVLWLQLTLPLTLPIADLKNITMDLCFVSHL